MEQVNILIFRTSIRKKQDIRRMAIILDNHPLVRDWNVDFDDWEKILRIESSGLEALKVSEALRDVDIWAVELE